MLTETTVTKLREMRLSVMANAELSRKYIKRDIAADQKALERQAFEGFLTG